MAMTDEHGELGECVKCASRIPTDADRCRECGYEPGPGILGGIVMWVSGMLASVFVTIALATLVVIFTGFPIVDGLIVFLFAGGIGAALLGIVYGGFRAGRRGPTDRPTHGERAEEETSIAESWQDGIERGDAFADRVGQLGPAIIAVLPSWTWTAGVLLGVVLHLALWVVTGQEGEIGMSVALLGGITVSFAAILGDTFRVKWRENDYSPRWWFWTILGMIPLFGWIFGLLWVGRKRQKTGSAV